MEEGKSFPSQVPKSLAGPKDASHGKGGAVSLAWHLYWPAQGMPGVEEEEQLPDLASHNPAGYGKTICQRGDSGSLA